MNRRRLLQAGGAGLAAGLAGCTTGTRERTYTASWASLSTDGRPSGVAFLGDDELRTTRTRELSEFTVEATVVSHTARYERTYVGGQSPFTDEASVGVVSTPEAREFGQTLNPVATRSLEELLTGNNPFLAKLDVRGDWESGPTLQRETSAEMLGTAATVETYTGTTTDGEFVLLNAARVTVDGDVVLFGDAHTRPADEGTEAGSDTLDLAVERFRELLPLVVRERDPDGEAATPTTDDPSGFPPGRVPMEEVPADVRRRAARLLEESHGTPVEWQEPPSLGSYAHLVERPDVEGTAYYELAVEPQGFVVAATGEHDAPLPHWNTDAETMGVRLEEQGEGELGRLVWIDRLRYVAENTDGEKMAARGNEVPKIRGLEALLDLDDEGARMVRHGPPGQLQGTKDDGVEDGYEPERLEAENDLELPEEFAFEQWESHEELLEGYEEAYGPLLEDLAERAAEAWAGMEENQGAVAPDATRREPLIDGETIEAVEGAGAVGLDVTRRSRERLHDVLEVTPTGDATPGDEVRVELSGGDRRTTLTFHVEDGAELGAGGTDWVRDTDSLAQTDWAGGFRLHPWYHQYDYQGCPVGCGPVGWALLFGWGDKQAHGGQFNSTWWPRYGLYLDGGGNWANGDRKAPDHLRDDNDGPMNVIEELNGYVDVFCIGKNNGATHPKDMDEARAYFRGRTFTQLRTRHSWSGRPVKKARVWARESIRGNASGKGPTPVVVGKGWLSHYPMAYAYKSMFWHPDKVKVNNGWGTKNRTGGDFVEWIWAQTWFSGEIFP